MKILLNQPPLKIIDQQISDDAEALFSGEKSGHLSYIHYGGPEFEGDTVQGAQQWINLQKYPDYYLSHEELALVPTVSKAFSDLNLSHHIVDLGTGDGQNVLNKTIPLIKDIPAESYCAVDFSEYYAENSAKLVHEILGIKSQSRSFNFLHPSAEHTFKDALLLMTGSTLTNIPMDKEARSGHMALTKQFLNLRRLITKTGQLFIGVDTNQNKEELDRAYRNEHHALMSEDVLLRILRDTDIQIDTNAFEYHGQWIAEEHRYAQLLVAKYDTIVQSPNRIFHVKCGQEFNIDNSFKFPLELLAKAASNAGWNIINTWTQTGRVHYILLEAK
jgi:uncharacterized SAM-dependent methyltransferase